MADAVRKSVSHLRLKAVFDSRRPSFPSAEIGNESWSKSSCLDSLFARIKFDSVSCNFVSIVQLRRMEVFLGGGNAKLIGDQAEFSTPPRSSSSGSP